MKLPPDGSGLAFLSACPADLATIVGLLANNPLGSQRECLEDPHLTYDGGWRAQIEGVRVAAEVRAGGVGRAKLAWAS